MTAQRHFRLVDLVLKALALEINNLVGRISSAAYQPRVMARSDGNP